MPLWQRNCLIGDLWAFCFAERFWTMPGWASNGKVLAVVREIEMPSLCAPDGGLRPRGGGGWEHTASLNGSQGKQSYMLAWRGTKRNSQGWTGLWLFFLAQASNNSNCHRLHDFARPRKSRCRDARFGFAHDLGATTTMQPGRGGPVRLTRRKFLHLLCSIYCCGGDIDGHDADCLMM